MKSRSDFSRAKRVVIKIGSALLTEGGKGLNQVAIADWVDQIVALKQRDIEVILVSSGSVAEGMVRLGLKVRPKALHELQAAASVGQMGLVRTFETNFQRHDLHAAQVLLTHDDLSDRNRYLNARSTLLTLLKHKVIPVVNENDAVATEEIRFGDNDTLGALVANLVEADLLIILTDQLGLFDSDPSIYANAHLISEMSAEDSRLAAMAGGSRSGLGRGGMATKVSAARLASRSGASTVIASGVTEQVISKVIAGERVGTYLYATIEPIAARKQWLAAQLQVKGRLILDTGAVKVLKYSGKSLLAVGIKSVQGDFSRGELVACLNEQGREIARGLVNYPAAELVCVKGKSSHQFEALLGYADDEEVIHRDNLVLV